LNPINAFVADFMGYRNLLTMEVSKQLTVGSIEVNLGSLKLVSTNFSSVSNLGKVKVAIRPDNLELSTSGENLIQGKVISAEYQGREYALEVEVDSKTSLIVRTAISSQVGSNISLSVAANRVLVFPDSND